MKHLGFGLLLGFAIFLVATVISYFARSDGHGVLIGNDGIQCAGFPLVFWERGGFAYRHNFSVSALAADLVVTVFAGIVISVLWRLLNPDHLE